MADADASALSPVVVGGPRAHYKTFARALANELCWRQVVDSSAAEYTTEEKKRFVEQGIPPWAAEGGDVRGGANDIVFKLWHELCAEKARREEAITQIIPSEAFYSIKAFTIYIDKISATIVALEAVFEAQPERRTPAWAEAQADREAKMFLLGQSLEYYKRLRRRARVQWTGRRITTKLSKGVPPILSDADYAEAAAPDDSAVQPPAVQPPPPPSPEPLMVVDELALNRDRSLRDGISSADEGSASEYASSEDDSGGDDDEDDG